jgi:phosphonate metabolism protein (transferase hexapeptide repeat family)
MNYVNHTEEIKKLSEQPTIDETAKIFNSYLGAWTEIGPRVLLVDSVIGDYTYLMDEVNIHYTEMGKFCSIASHVCINPGNHPMWRVTQHHITYRSGSYDIDTGSELEEEIFNWRKSKQVKIGNDVWIGHGVTIMPGITIGNGAVIGSGSVVTKDVEAYSIWAGVPAKLIRYRFETDVIRKLEAIAWWDWPGELIADGLEDMKNMELFLRKYS